MTACTWYVMMMCCEEVEMSSFCTILSDFISCIIFKIHFSRPIVWIILCEIIEIYSYNSKFQHVTTVVLKTL